ncbi:hypothetical protein K504DRAFT_254937 [Pleomassaria siparia CBS 279.74]|uniref:EF-hand domain-containing protein n=1 Tax=Pleomassaria siparia CBS 279.74 TaxID=1314801 RepID=A0A6G1KBH9_9PLEO|nr:hypothetical protein K504DRAFT_254937 [Pleomassaria siparia CBS 279.74]
MSLPYFSLNTREALSSTASLYTCDGCSEYIPAAKARLDCDNCVPKHDTCANCYVVGNYTKGHVEGHTSSLIVQSGFRPQPPPMPPRGQDAGGSRQQNQETYGQQNMNVKQQQQQQQQQRQYPQSVAPVQQNQQSQYAQSPAPVQQYQQSKQGYGQQQVYGQQHVPAHQYTPTQQYAPVRQQVVPLPQASPSAPRTPTQGTSQPSPSGWQPLFSGSAPTATYTAFLQAVFARLDTDKDGLISPEQYSAFLDVQQYRLEEDVCTYIPATSLHLLVSSIH